jgi:hypothetical protein
MPIALSACNSRTGTAAWEYALRHLGRRHPDAKVFREVEQRLRETESVTRVKLVNTGRSRTVRTPANEDTITAGVKREPWRSSRDIVRDFRLSLIRDL